jgi:hypothetical protein
MTTNWDPRTGRLVAPPAQPPAYGYPPQQPAQPHYPGQIRPADPPPRTDYQALAAQLSAPQQPPIASPPPKPAAPPKGWWRRNRWGLLLLIPALVLALVAPVMGVYDMLWTRQERLPLAGGTTTWVTYGGVRVRLVELSEEKDLPGYGGRREPAPAGMRVVKVVLGFDGPGEALSGCEVWLESTTGERFSANPDELDDAKLGYGSCAAEDGAQPTVTPVPSGGTSAEPSVTSSPDSEAVQQWRTETYFVMPLTSYPRSVRIVARTQLPEYVLLS